MAWLFKNDWVTNPRNPTNADLDKIALDFRTYGGDVDGAGHSLFNLATLYTTGNVGVGTGSPGISASAGRTYLTVRGSADAGVVELAQTAADASGAAVGLVQWTDVNSTAGDKRVASLAAMTDGTTANNRGGQLRFFTKADAANGLVQRMVIDRLGSVGIGTATPNFPLEICNVSAANSALGYVGIFRAGADVTLGPVYLALGGYPSATATQRYGFLAAGDSVSNRPLVLNPSGGNVGIGTLPTDLFHIKGSVPSIIIENTVASYTRKAKIDQYNNFLRLGEYAVSDIVVIDLPNNKVGINCAAPGAMLDVGGMIRAIGATTMSSGAGVELNWAGATGYVTAIDRNGGSTYKPLRLNGFPIVLNGDNPGYIVSCAVNSATYSNATAEALMGNGSICMWLDEASNRLVIRARYSSAALHYAYITLT